MRRLEEKKSKKSTPSLKSHIAWIAGIPKIGPRVDGGEMFSIKVVIRLDEML